MYKKILVSISFFSFQLIQTSAAASAPGAQLEVQDVLEVAQASFKDVQKITFSPDGKYAAILLKDNGIVVRKTDDLKKECYTYNDSGFPANTVSDVVFCPAKYTDEKTGPCVYYRHGQNPVYYGFFAELGRLSDVINSGSVDLYQRIKEDEKTVTLIVDPQDFSRWSSVIFPKDRFKSEHYVFCPSGPVTTPENKKIIKRGDGTLVLGVLGVFKEGPQGTLFCEHCTLDSFRYSIMNVNKSTGIVEVEEDTKEQFKTDVLEFGFTKDGVSMVIKKNPSTAKNGFFINKPGDIQYIPDGLSFDINRDDKLALATKTDLLVMNKSAGRYTKEKQISHKVENAIVRFNVPGDMIIRLSFDKKNNGLRCTVFDLNLNQMKKMNIEPLVLEHDQNMFFFPKSNPELMILPGEKYGAIVKLPEIKKESDAGGEA